MRRGTRRLLLALPVLLSLLFLAAYLLVDAWLEGAGGRRALERALQDRIGLPVRLEGEFRVVLLPSVGVSGTALVVGEPGPASELLRSGSYAVSLALEPLFHRRLSIDSVEFGNGTLHLERWPASEAPSTQAPQSTVQLPEIERLEILDFKVFAAADGDQPYLLRELSIEQFAAGRASPFRLDVEDYGAWDGTLTWDPQRSALDVTAAGAGFWSGEIQMHASALLDAGTGNLSADWAAVAEDSGRGRNAQLSLTYVLLAGGVRMHGIRLAAESLLVEGEGCLLTGERPALHLELAAGRVDADALPDWTALSGPGDTEAADPAAGLDLNIRLKAAEMLAGGAVARQAVLQLGGVPDCTPADAATAD
jgi:uncharacterized protein involved in outer membrane biogenesis